MSEAMLHEIHFRDLEGRDPDEFTPDEGWAQCTSADLPTLLLNKLIVLLQEETEYNGVSTIQGLQYRLRTWRCSTSD